MFNTQTQTPPCIIPGPTQYGHFVAPDLEKSKIFTCPHTNKVEADNMGHNTTPTTGEKCTVYNNSSFTRTQSNNRGVLTRLCPNAIDPFKKTLDGFLRELCGFKSSLS